MKILIAFDGSCDCRAAIEDLRCAGLPSECEVVVLTVADILILPSRRSTESTEFQVHLWTMAHEEAQAEALASAAALAESGVHLVQAQFPHWTVKAESLGDSPAWGVIRRADEWQPDLIVCGAQGHSNFFERVLGSVSQRVLYEARCSVRIGRRTPASRGSDRSDGALRLLVCWDASTDALAALERVAYGAWPANSQVRFITAHDQEAVETHERESIQDPHVARRFNEVGLAFETVIRQGTPKHAILNEAKLWRADAIFLGAQGFASTIGRLNLLNQLERAWAGSTAAAVAALAPCSVEIARAHQQPD